MKGRRLAGIAALSLTLVLLTGCGSEDGDEGEGGGDGAPPSVSKGNDDLGTTRSPAPRSQTTGNVAGLRATYEYLAMDPTDREPVSGVPEAKLTAAATQACAEVGTHRNPSQYVEYLIKNEGYTRASAQAMVAAAIRMWCPDANTGYRTEFERQVETVDKYIASRVGDYDIDSVELGRGIQLVCAHMNRHGRNLSTLDDKLRSETSIPPDAYAALAEGATDHWCIQWSDQLPLDWRTTTP
jgi:hypothetical protein